MSNTGGDPAGPNDGPAEDQDQPSEEGFSPWDGLDMSGLTGSGPGLTGSGSGLGGDSAQMGDMSGMLAQVQQMQQQLMQAQEALAEAQFSGSAGGDLVEATVSGTGELLSVSIKPAACDPEDTETLSDLVVAAVRAATDRQREEAAAKLGPMAGGLGL
jgi:DNA-binding YbaB/EbfC family protein